MAAVLTGRILLQEASKKSLTPSSAGFSDFVEKFIVDYHGFLQPLQPDLEQQISTFVKDWSQRIGTRFRDKKIASHLDRLLIANYPAYLDREIRFVARPPTPPRSPQPSGRIIFQSHFTIMQFASERSSKKVDPTSELHTSK